MKKTIGLLILIIIFFFPMKVYASSTEVKIDVEGSVKNGEEIGILVNMKNLEGLYAASVDFSYDKSVLNIISISLGDSIKKYEGEIMEIGGEVDTDNNKTSYSFTFLGDKEGMKGDGTLAIIKAKILNEDNLQIGQDAMKIKLVKRAGDSVDDYNYNFIGYNKESNEVNQQDEANNNPKESTSSDSSNIGNNDVAINDSEGINNDSTDSNSSINTNGQNLENNNDENQHIDEIKSSNEESIKNEDKTLNVGKSNKEASKNNSDSLVYILMSVLILIGGIIGGIYYFKFRKSKVRNE